MQFKATLEFIMRTDLRMCAVVYVVESCPRITCAKFSCESPGRIQKSAAAIGSFLVKQLFVHAWCLSARTVVAAAACPIPNRSHV